MSENIIYQYKGGSDYKFYLHEKCAGGLNHFQYSNGHFTNSWVLK